WETSPLPVAGLIYLKRDPARYGFFPLTPTQLIPPLLGETISMESQITRAKTVFDLITLAVTLPDLCLGKLSYPLGVDFWPWIAEHGANTINERVCKYEQDEL
ncbi:MAG: hypothetical protein KDD35_07565, partial [Bdellovibrionales bacterium]|nr:hypothetical protein [Bdellovibrionales bacterium]